MGQEIEPRLQVLLYEVACHFKGKAMVSNQIMSSLPLDCKAFQIVFQFASLYRIPLLSSIKGKKMKSSHMQKCIAYIVPRGLARHGHLTWYFS